MANTKLYPYSKKHDIDIQYYRNVLFCRYDDGEDVGEELQAVEDLQRAMMYPDPKVAWLTGKQIGLAKEITAWAAESRSSKMIEHYGHE